MRIARTDIQIITEKDLGEKLVPETEIHCGSTGMLESVSGKLFFLKCGGYASPYMQEARGLAELAAAAEVKTSVVASVREDYILTEYVSKGSRGDDFFKRFGGQLARLHRHTASDFGFYEDNFIGRNPQPNIAEGDEKSDWIAFFHNKRLLYQFRLAEEKGYGKRLKNAGFGRLEKKLRKLLAGTEEQPSLLHGDLWNGNYLCDASGDPVLIDPAVYYGHREADIAMTMLFGGFPDGFYAAYNEEYPLSSGWRDRVDIYNLYHILNHLNIFGLGYMMEAEAIIARYSR